MLLQCGSTPSCCKITDGCSSFSCGTAIAQLHERTTPVFSSDVISAIRVCMWAGLKEHLQKTAHVCLNYISELGTEFCGHTAHAKTLQLCLILECHCNYISSNSSWIGINYVHRCVAGLSVYHRALCYSLFQLVYSAVGKGSCLVGIGTKLRVGQSEQKIFLFTRSSIRPTQPPIQWVPAFFPY